MKNKITLLAFLLFAAYGARAQECDPTGSYTQDFESATVPVLPNCTTAINAGSGSSWVTVNTPGNGFESNTLHYDGNAEAADAWFFTKGVTLEANTYYKISYRFGNDSDTTTESFVFTKGLAPNAASAEEFVPHNAITGGTPATQLIEMFMNPTAGTYYFGFHATSAAGQGSLYVDNIIIEPTVCGTPTNVLVSNVAQTTATVSWGPPTGSNIDVFSVYQYAVTTTGEPPADGTFYPMTSIDLTLLAPGTTYYVFTRSLCGPLWSDWTPALPFTTATCDAATIPYYQDFETAVVPAMPDCTSATDVETGNEWVTANNPGNGFESNTLQYADSDEPANAWFFTQGIQMEQGSYYKLTYTYGNDSATTAESLKAAVATSPNGASVTYVVNELTGITGGTSSTYTSNIVGVPASGIYYFGFNAYSVSGQGNLYVDNIEVEAWDCGLPQNISISAITTTSATVSWETPEEATSFGYLIAAVAGSEVPDSGEYVTGLTKNLTELTPGTTYYIYVRSQCGPLMGEWAPVSSFTTPACEPTNVPYALDFESATIPGFPECTLAASGETGSDWVTAANPSNGFASATLQYQGNDEAADAWFFTRGINITAGTRYKVTYKYGNNNTTGTESLKVTLNTNPNPGAEWVMGNFAEHAAVTGGAQLTNTVEYFNLPESGVYYFGFNAYSAAGTGSVFMDDFLIEEMECGVPSGIAVTNITENSADVSWEAPTTGNAAPAVYQYAYATTDTPPADGTFDPDMAVSLDELEPGTTYYLFTRTLCGPLWSDWTSTPFTTQTVSGTGETAFRGFSAYPNPVKNSVTLSNTGTIDSVEIYTITGQLVHTQDINSTEATIVLDRLPTGAYLMTVHADGESKKVKLIKE